jgi:alpha-ribazole phosphatase
MLKVVFIRHFATEGNLQKRYIGVTDEPLCEEGKRILKSFHYPEVEAVFASPMLRCVETAKLIYPKHKPVLCEGLRECDFGDFENKNYKELSNDTRYQAWIDSNGTLPFPGGEDLRLFKARSVKAFNEMLHQSMDKRYKSIGVVAHGGTIMSILDQYSSPHEDYFYWQVGTGHGYFATWKEDDRRLIHLCTIH